jgi:hypothetical protein
MAQFGNIEEYLTYVGRFRESGYGRQFRTQFRDNRGTAELAMLAAPSEAEYEEFRRVVEAMTEAEKAAPEKLSDAQIAELAVRAGADCGNVSIFINGYVLAQKNANMIFPKDT